MEFVLFLFFFFFVNSSHHHPDSFAKNCDVCNAKASHSQAAAAIVPQAKNSPKSIAAIHVTENSVIFTNNSSSLNQIATATAAPSSISSPIENSNERGKDSTHFDVDSFV